MALPLSRGALARVVPFVLFMLLLAVRGSLPADGSAGVDPRWTYAIGVLLAAGALWWFRREYGELARQSRPDSGETLLAVVVGLVVFVLWITLDAPWMTIGSPTATFLPVDAAGRVDWPLVAVRWAGAALLVPVMEELFWRSFLMRWIERPQFEAVAPQRVGLKAVVLSTFVFMLAHTLWLAAIVAGLAYAWLYVRTGKLWVPIVAHAVTNGALGVWVVATRNWTFW
ncbi:CAAX prenyl protease-related protein [Piscinibacter sp. XHJ-5]|uniref:CAAX prenyl protease-related protein n=1 Tax=Piscinibacter sp. XHJ-5 TaxID=3037797 RepID=UPI0024534B60|nr:CAAX prenyl protease-related protein [Piscinibacter sp. XHJ-5]